MPYEALLYCWGDPTATDYLWCGEAHLSIGQSLGIALRHLRKGEHCRTLWVDAICINQDDIDERNVQVQNMHHIYRRAGNVIIWLGVPEPGDPVMRWWDARMTFELAKKLADTQECHEGLNIRGTSSIQRNMTMLGLGFPILKHSSYAALRAIFTRPWFRRMWVVQEAVLVSKATAMCSTDEMSWYDFTRGVGFGLHSGPLESTHERKIVFPVYDSAPPASLSAAILMYYLGRGVTEYLEPNNLLQRFHGALASDPRDKVFALFGLTAADGTGEMMEKFDLMGVRPDYRMDYDVLCRKTAQGVLTTSRILDILSIAPSRDDWPSWVLDWNSTDPQTEFLSYRAELDWAASRDNLAFPRFEGGVLILRRIWVDRITNVVSRDWKAPRVSDVVAGEDASYIYSSFLFMIAQMIEWEKLPPSQFDGKYVTGEDYVDVYWALVSLARSQSES